MPARRAVIVVILALTIIGTGVLFGAFNLRHARNVPTSSTVLVFDVPSELEESEPPFGPLALRRGRATVYDVTEALRQAAEDDQIEALVVHIGDIEWGWAKAAEVRDAIQTFRQSGKPVFASLSGGGEIEYLVASEADLIAMPPAATLQLDGLTLSALFFRGTFDKLDITPNFAHAGRYKSGPEQYTRTDMTPDSRAALRAVLDDQVRWLADSLASARGLSPDSVRHLLDQGPFTAKGAFERGLIDTLLRDSEVDSLAVEYFDESVSTLEFSHYLEHMPHIRTGPSIALITASGSIYSGKNRAVPGEGVVLGAESAIEALQQARERHSIKAVVLRVDSPGGSLQASDDIWREVQRCQQTKPVVVSMSDFAASGGYYIAAAADRIVAQPTTLTGSIGVYGGKLNLLGLFHKLGLHVETLSEGRHAGMMSPFRDFSDEEARLYQGQLEEGYRLFLERVSEGRGLSLEEADSVAQGRVWSGLKAVEKGLVDTLGGIETAVALALQRAGLPSDQEPEIVRLPKVERSLFERMLEEFLNEGGIEPPGVSFPPVLEAWIAAAHFPVGISLALMPFSIEIR